MWYPYLVNLLINTNPQHPITNRHLFPPKFFSENFSWKHFQEMVCLSLLLFYSKPNHVIKARYVGFMQTTPALSTGFRYVWCRRHNPSAYTYKGWDSVTDNPKLLNQTLLFERAEKGPSNVQPWRRTAAGVANILECFFKFKQRVGLMKMFT